MDTYVWGNASSLSSIGLQLLTAYTIYRFFETSEIIISCIHFNNRQVSLARSNAVHYIVAACSGIAHLFGKDKRNRHCAYGNWNIVDVKFFNQAFENPASFRRKKHILADKDVLLYSFEYCILAGEILKFGSSYQSPYHETRSPNKNKKIS